MRTSKFLICVLWFVGMCLVLAPRAYSQLPAFDDTSVVKVYVFENIDTVMTEDTSSLFFYGFPSIGHGSGVMVDSSGLVLTAKHVVEGARFLAVRIPASSLIYPADVVYIDPRLDFAVISIKGSFRHYTPLPLAAPSINKGQKIWAYGYPMLVQEQAPTVTSGTVSNYSTTFNLWQVDAAINKGNSGGPVVDSLGKIIGIAIAKLPEAEEMNYVLPIKEVSSTYAELHAAGRIMRRDFSWERMEVRVFLAGIIEDLAFEPKSFVQQDFTSKIASFISSKNKSYESIEEMADLYALVSSAVWTKMTASAIEEGLTDLTGLLNKHTKEFSNSMIFAVRAAEIDDTIRRLAFVDVINEIYEIFKKVVETTDTTSTVEEPGPTVALVTPNGGEELKVGSSQLVEWELTEGQNVNEYKLEYSTDDGETWETIEDWSTPNNGYYRWRIPETSSKKCLLKVWCRDDSGKEDYDISDENFRIKK